MMKCSIQYHINRQLQCNVKLHQLIVASTASCALYRFTTLKSDIVVGFSALSWQSGDVVTLYQTNTMPRRHSKALLYQGCTRVTSWKLRAGWELGCKLRAALSELIHNSTSCELDGTMKLQ